MTGWDVLATLKADAALASIPVIMLTLTDDQCRALTMGAVDFLTKPVDAAHLVRVLQRHQKGAVEAILPKGAYTAEPTSDIRNEC